jgi:two-component system NtrC family sensor kinase
MRKRSIPSPERGGAVSAQRRSSLEARVPQSSPLPQPSPSSEVSSSRPRLTDGIPQLWHDRLLLATVDLPIASGGEGGVVESMIGCVASILSGYEVGASLPDGHGGESALYLRRSPSGHIERFSGPAAAARLFPALKYEYLAPVPGPHSAPTLHVASDDDEAGLDSLDGCPAVHLLDRAAVVLAHALPKARAAAVASAKNNAAALERRMMQADKLATFGQLAAGVVHELNNPLTSIVAYSDYLIRKVVDGRAANDPEDLERLRRISESANRMLRFTRELVGYARPSNGAVGTVGVHRVIDQAIAFCEHVLSEARVVVERRYVVEALQVQGVAEQLVQVFVNLLTNACQAAPESGGRILVTTGYQDGPGARAFITVEDNGSGIAPENLQHMFVPFFTTKRETHGTGLGLSIIKNIVASHDGTIRVESQLGQGTRFFIEVPAIGF